MSKTLKSGLFLLLSIYILVLNPLFSVLAKEHCHHHTSNRKHNLSGVHLHNTSWSLIANRQLSAPPSIVKVKTNIILLAVFSLLRFILSSQIVKAIASVSANLFPNRPAPPLYLLNRLLLI